MANRGVFYSPVEVAAWKARWNAKNKFWNKGDVRTNSPDDGARILRNANTFAAAPLGEQWSAPAGNSCVQQWTAEPHTQGFKTKDAGFAYLMTGDVKYLNAVKQALLTQAANATVDFSNSNRWCLRVLWDLNPSFIYTEWIARLAFAYDCIRFDITQAERNTLNTWFLNAAIFWKNNVEVSNSQFFVNNVRDTTLSSLGLTYAGRNTGSVWDNGPLVNDLAKSYNNRKSNHLRLAAIIGCMLNNQELKDAAKFWFKEHLKYSTYPDGVLGDFERGTSAFANLGWAYSTQVADHLVQIADCFARTGDTSLYTYSTSVGAGTGTGTTAGGPKSLLTILKRLVNFQNTNYSPKRYKGGTASGNLIDGTQESNSWYSVADTWYCQANMYYKDNDLKGAYNRTASGTIAYPANPNTVSGNDTQASPWAGGGGLYPGKLFMWGDYDNVLNPYDLTLDNPTEPEPDPEPDPEPVTLRQPENPANLVQGVDFKYVEGTWTVIPNFDSLTATSSGSVANFSMSPRRREDFFAFEWTGYIQIPSDGEYTFYLSSDDGSKFYIGNTLVVDHDGLHATTEKSGKIGLKAGRHICKVQFLEYDGAAVCNVSYSSPTITKTLIPDSILFRPKPVVVVPPPVVEDDDNVIPTDISDLNSVIMKLHTIR